MFLRISSIRTRTLTAAAGLMAVIAAVSVAQTTMTKAGSAAPADFPTADAARFTSNASNASNSASSTTGSSMAADEPTSGCSAGTVREDAFHLAHGQRWVYDPTVQDRLLDAVRADQATPTADGRIDCDSPEIAAFLAWARSWTAGRTPPAGPPAIR